MPKLQLCPEQVHLVFGTHRTPFRCVPWTCWVGGKHKSICWIPQKIQRFDDPLEHFLRKSCREEGNKNIDRELRQYFSKLAICCAECKLLTWLGLSSYDDEMCFIMKKNQICLMKLWSFNISARRGICPPSGKNCSGATMRLRKDPVYTRCRRISC